MSLLEKRQQGMQVGQGMGRASGNEQIHGEKAFEPFRDLRVAVKRPAGNRAGAHGDHHL